MKPSGKMKSKVCILVAILWTFVLPVEPDTSPEALQAKEDCRTAMGNLMAGQFQNIANCAKLFKRKDEKVHRSNCILRCVMIIIGICDKDGQMKFDQRDYFIKKYFPENLVNHANKTFQPCMEIAQKSQFKTIQEDDMCSAYEPFLKCAIKAFPNICIL